MNKNWICTFTKLVKRQEPEHRYPVMLPCYCFLTECICPQCWYPIVQLATVQTIHKGVGMTTWIRGSKRFLSLSSHPVLKRGCLVNQKMKKRTGDSFYLFTVWDHPQLSVPNGKDKTLRIIPAIEDQKGLFLTRLTVEFSAVTFERSRFVASWPTITNGPNESWHYMLVRRLYHLCHHSLWKRHTVGIDLHQEPTFKAMVHLMALKRVCRCPEECLMHVGHRKMLWYNHWVPPSTLERNLNPNETGSTAGRVGKLLAVLAKTW